MAENPKTIEEAVDLAVKHIMKHPDKLSEIDQVWFDSHPVASTLGVWSEFSKLFHNRYEKAQIRARLQASQKQLKERDSTLCIPAWQLEKFEAVLREWLPEDVLADFNQQLSQKSTGITYTDIAFVAIVHRVSVTTNGGQETFFKGTSPFKRMVKASMDILHRKQPLDHRQIRYAITILEDLGFTTMISKPTVYQKGKRNTAAVYEISTKEMWVAPFRNT